jgi:NDP-4-keto-2,6-dideoxyhexose 3-C-methyltransferase
MPDPNKFVSDVKDSMHDKTVWVIQQNYILPTLQLGALDNFCHEHLEYYSLLSLENLLERHGLEVFDLRVSMINGGSIRTLVCKKGAYPVQDSVERQRTVELDAGLHTLEPYFKFAEQAENNIRNLREAVDELKREGKTVYILAASTRGATIWQAVGLSAEVCPFAVERNPAKVGKYFSALGIPIISEEEARERNPDAMLVGPWFFIDEVIDREQDYLNNGCLLIAPLPEVKIYGTNQSL